mmetsp:Transcript_19254/g.36894  ORF Transcript_19254/g.36894 Transcript_19254/m.36894 type:complete len:122 (+) Transcript_19254:114-479(+)
MSLKSVNGTLCACSRQTSVLGHTQTRGILRKPQRVSCSTTGSKSEGSKKTGVTGVFQSMYEGMTARMFNANTYEPDTSRAMRKGVCPRCDSLVTEEMPKHKSGWCDRCQEENNLVDVSDGF